MTNKLSDILPSGTIGNPIRTDKKAYYDKPIVIVAVTFSQMEKGEVARIVFTCGDDGKNYYMLSGSQFVIPKLKAVVEDEQLPVECTLVKVGQSDDLN